MTLIFSEDNWDELHQQVPPLSHARSLDDFETVDKLPNCLGVGQCRNMELSPGVSVGIASLKFYQDVMLKVPAHEHPIQITIFLSGVVYFDEVHPDMGGGCGYFSGSGISPAYVEKQRAGQRVMMVNVELLPEVLAAFLPRDRPAAEIEKLLIKQNDWKASFYPTVTAKMRTLAQQIVNAPYRGMAKRIYLQGKVFELLAMQLDALMSAAGKSADGRLKPSTIDCIYHARDLLLANLEQPPSIAELAQQIGLSDRTLQRGFQSLFGTTIFGYLTAQRMELAEQWLQQGSCTVADVATRAGYSNPGHFAAAFKRRFGITPRECLLGKKSVSRSF